MIHLSEDVKSVFRKNESIVCKKIFGSFFKAEGMCCINEQTSPVEKLPKHVPCKPAELFGERLPFRS